ncbi:hypothetical protein H310_13291 [Aphanomyces invadans]|uniref:TNFR-Cys domain-containing protein n=1 Tax=Aphanomyces invadans TaxID=157072 RepID=A0A024TEG0_9STRA|nr:hypothetical protein H310_13291 [Aphanomyces invadans]ETV92403.1 hypothetical protein H310_13291 [Aphanomyces invadans]|eukprot:XP_008878954.1 hypothetical protein H310_13291 [Aphanomyces invadans]
MIRLMWLSFVFASASAHETHQPICDDVQCLTPAKTICIPSTTTTCPPCWSRHGELVHCGPAFMSSGMEGSSCPRGTTRCSPTNAFVRSSRRRRLTDTTTIAPPSPLVTSAPTATANTSSTSPPNAPDNSTTIWYTLACVGLCCLVVLLYGVLRYINRKQAREEKQERDEIAMYRAGIASDKASSASVLVMSMPPPDTLSLHNPSTHNQRIAHPHDVAMQSMFHTVGRVSLTSSGPGVVDSPIIEDLVLPSMTTVEVAAPPPATRDSSASIVIMEDSGEVWDVDGAEDEFRSTVEGK